MNEMGLFASSSNEKISKSTVISLGEIIRPNHQPALEAFAEYIFGEVSNENIQKCGKILKENEDALNHFKLGNITEEEFIEKMLKAISTTENAKTITKDQFLKAWKLIQPKYAEFGTNLNKAIEWNDKRNNQLVFVSATNSIDMKALQEQLKIGNIKFKLGNKGDGDVIEIAGIQVRKTNTESKPKNTLITDSLLKAPINAEKAIIIGKNENVIECLRKEHERFTEIITESYEENSVKIIELSSLDCLIDCLDQKTKPATVFSFSSKL